MSLCLRSGLSIFRDLFPVVIHHLRISPLGRTRWIMMVALSCCVFLPSLVLAGGSGLNTIVVINQSSSNSCEVANYYCERRQIPPENVLRIYWPGDNISWSSADFQTTLLQPLLNMIASRQLTNQADYVVLSMDIPFKTMNGSAANSTTSALFYGIKPDAAGTANSYAASEANFRVAKPSTAPGYSFLATMVTGQSVAQVK